MSVDLEKIKKAKGRTYINVENCPIPICVEDYLEYKKIEKELGIDLITLFKILKDGIIVEDNKTICFREVALSYSEDRKSWHFMFKQQLALNERIGVFVKSSKYRYAFKEELE